MVGVELLLALFSTAVNLTEGGNLTAEGNGTKDSSNLCTTPACLDLAENMFKIMNPNINPCDDFYEYACGNWKLEHGVRPGTARNSQFTSLVDLLNLRFQEMLAKAESPAEHKHLKAAKRFHKKCIDRGTMNSRGLDPLLAFIKTNGGWPLIEGPAWNEKDFDLAQIIVDTRGMFGKGKLHPHMAEGLLFGLFVAPPKPMSQQYIIVRPPAFFESLEVLHHRANQSQKFEAYAEYVYQTVLELSGGNVARNETDLKRDIAEVIDFEVQLASQAADVNIFDATMETMNMRRIQSYFKQPPALWKLAKMLGSGKEVSRNQAVIVIQPDYFANLKQLLKSTPTKTVANYVQWRIVSELLSETTDRMRDIQFQYQKNSFGLKEPESRQEICAGIGGRSSSPPKYTFWGYALAEEYMRSYLPLERIPEIADVIQSLRFTFQKHFENKFGEFASIRPLQILANIGVNIGVPEWIYNSTELDVFYQRLNLTGNHHFENHLTFLSWQFDKEMALFWKEADTHKWNDNPLSVMAGYDPGRVYVVFTAGFLNTPFYNPDVPMYSQLGQLGFIIGHELTHGFFGVYDKHLFYKIHPYPHIKEQKTCIENHYRGLNNHTSDPVINYHQKKRFSEDYADIGGMDLAYEAFKNLTDSGHKMELIPGFEGFTPEKLFFLSYAQNWCETLDLPLAKSLFRKDIHSPGQYRTWGVLRNSKEFAKAYNCPQNSYMNPPEAKCALWK